MTKREFLYRVKFDDAGERFVLAPEIEEALRLFRIDYTDHYSSEVHVTSVEYVGEAVFE